MMKSRIVYRSRLPGQQATMGGVRTLKAKSPAFHMVLRGDTSDMGKSIYYSYIFYQFCCQHITVMSATKKTVFNLLIHFSHTFNYM